MLLYGGCHRGEHEFEKKGSLSIVRPPQTDETLTSQEVNGNAGAAPSLPAVGMLLFTAFAALLHEGFFICSE